MYKDTCKRTIKFSDEELFDFITHDILSLSHGDIIVDDSSNKKGIFVKVGTECSELITLERLKEYFEKKEDLENVKVSFKKGILTIKGEQDY